MLETRSVISRAKVIGIPLNTTQKTLGGHSPAFILEREANRYPFTAAVCRRTYPSIHPRTDAAKLYAHGEGFTSKAATSSPPDSSPTAVEDDTEEKFNWFKNWWLVQIVDNLETDRPNKIKLLNRDFIVWKGHSGEWIAMDDECPYRMALLSEGRIEDDGNLLCSYHAWRFNESGNCVKIPHAEDDKAHSVACNSPRSAVQTYPCKIRGPFLWIWPDRSDAAFVESTKQQFPLDDDIADAFERDVEKRLPPPYIRYLPYSYNTLLENLSDPAHFNAAHHGITPMLSRYNAKPLNIKREKTASNKHTWPAVSQKNLPAAEAHSEFRLPGVRSNYITTGDGEISSRNLLVQFQCAQGSV